MSAKNSVMITLGGVQFTLGEIILFCSGICFGIVIGLLMMGVR